jgi:hypothetical protein
MSLKDVQNAEKPKNSRKIRKEEDTKLEKKL